MTRGTRALARRRRTQTGVRGPSSGFRRWSTPSSCPTVGTGSPIRPTPGRGWSTTNCSRRDAEFSMAPTWSWCAACARRYVRCWCATEAARRRPTRRWLRCARWRQAAPPAPSSATTAKFGWPRQANRFRERLIELLLIMRDAQRDGSWARLKACANDECQWAFYDRSRNHGGTWCEMSACGNKLKNREFRARRRKAATR